MTIYVFLFTLLFISGIYTVINPKCKSKRLYVLNSILWTLIPALRSVSVGTDTRTYVDYFQNPQLGYGLYNQYMEPGFQLWNYIIRIISENECFYIFISALIVCLLKLTIIYKLSTKPNLSLAIMSCTVLLSPYYLLELSAMRQTLAIAFFMLFYFKFNKSGKITILNLTIGIIALLFHYSCVFAFVILGLCHLIRWKNKTAYLLCIALSIFLGDIALQYFQVLLSVFSFLDIELMTKYLDSITNLNIGYEYYRNIIPICYLGIFIIYFSPKDASYLPLFKLAFLGILSINIFLMFPIGQRLVYYLVPFIAIYVANIITRKNFKFILPILIFWLYRSFSALADQTMSQGGNIVVPYKTFLDL